MWTQHAQSPFRRYASAQVEGGGSGPTEAPDEPTSLRDAPSESGVILVVDDEPAIVESLTKIFRREGMNVLAATDGQRRARPVAQAARRRAAHRPHDAADQRHGPAACRQDDRAGDRGRADDRVRHGRDRGRRDERRRVRLHDQAAQARARRADRAQRAREAVAARREPHACKRAARREAAARDHRHVARVAAHDGHRDAGGAERGDRAAARRSGTGKELLARAIHDNSAPRERPVRRRQLRGDPRSRSSRRSCSATRRARSPARRTARDGRFEARATAARCSSTRSARSAGTCRSSCCASCRRARSSGSAVAASREASTSASSPRRTSDLARRGQGGRLSRGPVLPAQRDRGERAAAARPPRRHPAARAALRAASTPRRTARRSRGCSRHRDRAARRVRLARQRARARERDRARGRAHPRRRTGHGRRRRVAARDPRRDAWHGIGDAR